MNGVRPVLCEYTLELSSLRKYRIVQWPQYSTEYPLIDPLFCQKLWYDDEPKTQRPGVILPSCSHNITMAIGPL